MKVIAAIDSFKNCMSSKELNQAVLNALSNFPQVTDLCNIPIADGGEGTIAAVYEALGGNFRAVDALGPLGECKQASYLITSINGSKTAIIESAEIIGIHLLTPSEETITAASSFGLGLLIQDALNQGIEHICVTLGGSATSDGGLGMLAALGANFSTDAQLNNPLLHFKNCNIDNVIKKLEGIELTILSDVKNTYSGTNGAATTFGKQKGGNEKTIALLDQQAEKIANQWNHQYGIDINQIRGSGAAGGISGALAIIGGKIIEGFSFINDVLSLENAIKDAALIFTGEGRLDSQTENGKVPFGIASLAKQYNIPVVAICGARENDLGAMDDLLNGAFSIQNSPVSLSEALKKENAIQNINMLIPNIFKLFITRPND